MFLTYNLIAINKIELDMADEVTNSLLSDIQGCFENMSIVPSYGKNTCEVNTESCKSSSVCSIKKDTPTVDYLKFNSCCSHRSSDNIMCLHQPEKYLNPFQFTVSKLKDSYFKKTIQELNEYSLVQLQSLIEDLTHSVEEVSSELVQLLLENDSLQQESDARNIAIEQLLKMTVKVNESDLKPIQMSIILPDDDCDVI